MKQQKTKATIKLEQESILLDIIDDSELKQIVGGLSTQYTNPDPNRPLNPLEPEPKFTRAV